MKLLLLILLFAVIGYLIYRYAPIRFVKEPAVEVKYDTTEFAPPINDVFFQDASGSIVVNGVELITSQVFRPYFNDTHRDIQLGFGIIEYQTAAQLITVELRANRLLKPIPPNWDAVSFSERNALKKAYLAAKEKYEADSVAYCVDRAKRFREFCDEVDEKIEPFRQRLSTSTDFVPVTHIADNTFNYCFASKAINHLLIYSDGLDSRKRQADKLKNTAEVILINANGNGNTSLGDMVTRYFQSPEQAIEFSLNDKNLKQ